VGAKVTDTAQLPAALTCPPQLEIALKSPGFGPVTVTLVIASGTGLALLKVIACGALVVPFAVALNLRWFGVWPSFPRIPEPLSVTTGAVASLLLATVSDPLLCRWRQG
jgi:hypothetical protein